MKLCIDARNGLAGDITAAGLIGLGADRESVIRAMESAGEPLGGACITRVFEHGITRLLVSVPEMPEHLHASQARMHLDTALRKSGAGEPWNGMGRRVLEALIEAEAHVHSHHPALKAHFHGHEAVLHEASDIIIDITGMAVGMRELDIHAVEYLGPVNVGSGNVTFSHGTLEVPTPATKHILDHHGIPWAVSGAGMETTTPTGAAILAGCGASRALSEPAGCGKALAGGTRPLPPIAFFLSEG